MPFSTCPGAPACPPTPRPLATWAMARLAALMLATTLAACGGGGSEPPAPPPAATEVAAAQTAQASLGAAGGELLLSTREGASFRLELPAGALAASAAVSMTTEAATSEQRFNLRLAPAGLVLAAGQRARLTIRLPAAMALRAGAVIAYDGAPVAYERQSDGALVVQLAGFAGGATAGSMAGRARALAARALTGTPAAPCGGAPGTGSFGNGSLTGSDIVEIDIYGQCMVGAVQALAASGAYAEAIRVASATAALLQAAGVQGGAGNATAQAFITQASGIACMAYRNVLDTAQAGTVTTMGTLNNLLRPVLFWERTVQQLGAQCANVTPGEYVSLVDAKVAQAEAYYRSQRGAIVQVNGTEYTEAVNEARASNETVRQVQSLPAPPAMQQLLTQQIEQRAQPTLLETILPAPWNRCRDSGNHDELIMLMALMNQPQALQNAAQYCGSQLNAAATDSAGQATATLDAALGGVSAGQTRTSGTLHVAANGRLRLSGPIRALSCPAGSSGAESLVLQLNGTTVQTLATAPYLASPLELQLPQILQAAGLDAGNFSAGTLTVVRSGNPCNGFWGATPAPLLTLNLSSGICLPAQGQDWCLTLVEVAEDPGRHSVKALNNRGEVLFERYHADASPCQPADNPRQAPCGAVWKNGAMRNLPDRFLPTGIADDGTVGGNQLDGIEYHSSVTHPAVAAPGQTTSTRLATSVARTSSSGPNGDFSQMVSFSAAGRATYWRGENGYANSDMGFCVSRSASSYYCRKFTYYESSGPHWGPGSIIRDDRLPASGTTFQVMHDADSGGRVGAGMRYLGSVNFAMRDFNAGADGVINMAADSQGTLLQRDYVNGGSSLSPSSPHVPAGWFPVAIGRNGHVLVCGPDTQDELTRDMRLVDSRSGQQGPVGKVMRSTRIGNHEVTWAVNCLRDEVAARWVDERGRVLVTASSDTLPNLRAAIATPRGVALP
jgi:hypothetical protein